MEQQHFYANAVDINVTPMEVTLLFKRGEAKLSIILPYQLFKQLGVSLPESVRQIENILGREIETPEVAAAPFVKAGH